MSKLAPRNATVEFVAAADESTIVRKRYHAIYTASDEQAAYIRVSHLYRHCPKVRIARLIGIDEADNSITLEYVPGLSLYESAAAGDFLPLEYWHKELIAPFVQAKREGLPFDADPSNYIVHAETGELVAIDPVCADVQLDNYAAVVFFWGIIKLMLRTARFWRYPGLHRLARSFLTLYLAQSSVDPKQFNQEMVSYIDVVIGWNKENNPVDGMSMFLMRRAMAIPLYSVAQIAFRRNLIRPMRISS